MFFVLISHIAMVLSIKMHILKRGVAVKSRRQFLVMSNECLPMMIISPVQDESKTDLF